MTLLARLVGILLIGAALVLLGKNIFLTTQPNPWFWQGIVAQATVGLITLGAALIMFLKGSARMIGTILIASGILIVFLTEPLCTESA
jgi:hypothetical protein